MRRPPCGTKRCRNGCKPCPDKPRRRHWRCDIGRGADRCRAGRGGVAGRGGIFPWACRLGCGAFHPVAGVSVGGDLGGAGGAGGARAGAAAVCWAWRADCPVGCAVHPAGDCRGAGYSGGLWSRRLGESTAGALGFRAAVDLRIGRCASGPCVFQPAAGDAADPARLARHSGRTLPAGGATGADPAHGVSRAGMACTVARGAGRAGVDLRDLSGQLCRGADAGRGATGDHH